MTSLLAKLSSLSFRRYRYGQCITDQDDPQNHNVSQDDRNVQEDRKVHDDRRDQHDGQKQSVQQLSSSPTYSTKKTGYITKKRKWFIDVNTDGEIIKFNAENITEFDPRDFDRVDLICEYENCIDEDSPVVKVIKMKPSIRREISGKITYIDPNENGIIDGQYFFFWDLVKQYESVNKGDKVTASIIECEITDDNKFNWRCISIKKVESAIGGLLNNEHRHDDINNNGIEITEEVGVDFSDLHETKEFTMTVKNNNEYDCKVEKSIFRGKKSDSQIELISPTRSASFTIKPNEAKLYVFKATSKCYGEGREEFTITFSSSSERFKISRFIKIFVLDKEKTHNSIGTGKNVRDNRDYTRNVDNNRRSDIISGEKPKNAPNFTRIKFDDWKIPKEIKDIIFDAKTTRSRIKDKLDAGWPFLKENLSISNYNAVFHNLLYLEECELFHNIRKYDKFSLFTRENEYLALSIENVAETRPSLVIGDYVEIENYRGYIHEVKHSRILLKFNAKFHKEYRNERYEIKFYFSRRSLQKQHHAIELVTKNHPFILFPNAIKTMQKQVNIDFDSDNGEISCNESIIPWHNSSLNNVQKEAVANILKGISRPMPYVIFGPPGTGKTVTLVETILQIVKQLPSSRILVATPSNSAANLITQRIIESDVLKCNQFMRLIGVNKLKKELIPQNIIRYCGTIDKAEEDSERDNFEVTESGLRKNCRFNYLSRQRLLIGTCVTLGTLIECGFEDHFTHVIIDESGQCFETAVMIPISLVEKNIGQIILAGDPMQLGPVVHSRFAADRGLSQSYLARILDLIPYKPDPQSLRYDPRLVTKLVYNYRSLPSLISVYNELFYSKTLQPMIKDSDSNEAQILRNLRPILPNTGDRDDTQGVIFIGVEGKSEKTSDSPSWRNEAEADEVIKFFWKMIRMGHNADDIGIISPYFEQCKTIRALLQPTGVSMPKVGTVEEFQGQERQIILLSTVRTLKHQLIYDERYSLGFIRSPNRMNVAISRARALLVIFGSAKLLVRDQNWQFLIEHCIEKKCTVNVNERIVKRDHSDDDE